MKLNKTKIFGKYIFYYLANDKYVGQRIALEKYEPYETKLILRQTKPKDVIVDVGANIGYYTVLLADKVGKTGKVFAFEPDVISFEILKKNVEVNKLKNVVLINAAVSDKKGTTYLYKSKRNYGDHRMFGSEGKEKIKTIKLDNFFKNQKIDLMKIDTQGWEPSVFEGAKKIVEKYKPTIFFEYSPASYKLAKLDGKKMMSWLKRIYKKFWWIDEWLYIYKNLDKKKIDQICKTNKTGYADLWVKNEIIFGDKIGQIKNIKIKKVIKKILEIADWIIPGHGKMFKNENKN
ncbi:MAG: FkbM family methyltransferase [Candidatus Shapirobacteria bacterium]|nr:FkbM family methyltransferase [Candidatus Shapirobacteria bacterium]